MRILAWTGTRCGGLLETAARFCATTLSGLSRQNPRVSMMGRISEAAWIRQQDHSLERHIEHALRPRGFIRDGECVLVRHRPRSVADTVGGKATTEPSRAIALYE